MTYLCGYPEEEAVLLVKRGDEPVPRSTLFVLPNDPKVVQWPF